MTNKISEVTLYFLDSILIFKVTNKDIIGISEIRNINPVGKNSVKRDPNWRSTILEV